MTEIEDIIKVILPELLVYFKSEKISVYKGWEVIPERYDDGGYSGGNINRPALQKLLIYTFLTAHNLQEYIGKK